MAHRLDPQDHEKVKWPPLLALWRVARRTLAIWVKSNGAGGGAEKLSEEELGTMEEENSQPLRGYLF